ncbi:MAG: hypothetical protein ACJAZP_000290 [Psychromonas sp.]|jgi:hypothetical protein|uniref:COG3014 family protein n=1 Tax=Psychromonas sp. TaxID=1884585 RepID=UPI0039E3A3F1
MYKILWIVVITLLSGCTGYQRDSNQLAAALTNQSPESILAKLQDTEPKARDSAQFHLNQGFLAFITGDFDSAITTLTLAKKEMSALAATSISENVGAGTISETLRSYSGYPTDRVMVHNILALSYLFNGDIEGARVEILQADIAMKKLVDKNSLSGQLASAHLIAGIVYEMLNEQSNALISYRFALDIIKQHYMPVPLGLKQALLRMSFKLGAEQQFVDYQQDFPDLPKPSKKTENQVFVLYFDGVVSHKVERSVVVPSPNLEQLISISMPGYPSANPNIRSMQLRLPEQQVKTETVENLNVLVRDDLDRETPSILLLTTTRAVAKYELVRRVNQQNNLLGLLFNLATVVTDRADLRSWNMLPANIQFGYLETTANEVQIDGLNNRPGKIAILKGSQNIILIDSLSDHIFHYQQL